MAGLAFQNNLRPHHIVQGQQERRSQSYADEQRQPAAKRHCTANRTVRWICCAIAVLTFHSAPAKHNRARNRTFFFGRLGVHFSRKYSTPPARSAAPEWRDRRR